MPYATDAQLEDRLSAAVVKAIYDDNNDGSKDTNPIARLLADASAKVDGYLRGIYKLPLATPVPNEVVRLTLDVAEAYAAKRHPEYVRRDWIPMMEHVERELKNLRLGVTRLDIEGPPEPAANQGGEVFSNNPNCPEVKTFFVDGMGDF